jgi:hypothetical protein
MAEHVLRLLAPVLPIMRRIYRLRRRVGGMRFGQRRANWFVNRVAGRREAWQRTAARTRALYDIAHRAARAELGDDLSSEQQLVIADPTRDRRAS